MLKKIFLNERNILAAIVLNAFVISSLYFPSFRNNFYLEFLDRLFIYFFVIEALVKIKTLGSRKYFANNWNRFDFIIVAGSLPTLLDAFIYMPSTSFILILRLFRLFRLVHFIRFVPHLDKILAGLGRALKASFFVLLALTFLNFMLALITCHFYAEISPKHFGDPLTSFFSVFQIFTMEGWNEIASDISDSLAASTAKASVFNSDFIINLSRLYFIFVVLIGGVFGLSLANAVFVDEMTMDNNDEIEVKIDLLRQELADLKDLIKNQPKAP